jgi:hypothetical protein
MTSTLVPDYEVKLLLKPSEALGSDKKLSDAVRSAFSMPSGVTKMNVQFLDADPPEIYQHGWSPRLRKMEGDEGFELTYKKRYPINYDRNGPSDGTADIDTALITAKADGFGSNLESSYDAQVEVGYQKLTLSISYDDSYSDAGFSGMDLPGEEDSRQILKSKAPEEFKNSLKMDWGVELLEKSRIYGPILAKRSKGKWENIKKLYVEVWPIKSEDGQGIEYIVEASFKEKTYPEAIEKRSKLETFLQKQGWLLPQDSLKTSLIMERY